MANKNSASGADSSPPSMKIVSPINLRITAVVEREFKRRNIFPELRLEDAAKVINGATGVYGVTIQRAQEILADAEAQNRNHELPRGVPKAYGSLAEQIRHALKEEERRGAWEDPGLNEARARMRAASALLQVGTQVMLCEDANDRGRLAQVIEPFGWYQVVSERGAYIGKKDDRRFDHRPGYVIQCMGEDQKFFVPAHKLCLVKDYGVLHLQLVHTAAR